MSEIDIFRDFKDYACDECVENYDECDNDDCWAKIMYKQLKRLQEENEVLKEQLNIYMSQYEIKIPNKYRQALEIIREITEENIIDCAGSKCEGMEEIQKLINEVLNDRD